MASFLNKFQKAFGKGIKHFGLVNTMKNMHTHPDRAAHAALVTVVGLYLQQVRAAGLSVQGSLSSNDHTRQKVYTELTATVAYTRWTRISLHSNK